MSRISAACAALVALTSTPAFAIEFNEVARFNVSFAFQSDLDPTPEVVVDNPKYIGTNPLAVAWNGSKLYLGGQDNFGSSLLPVGIVEVLNPTRTGLVTLTDADVSAKFGAIFQPVGRGYTNLELKGDRLAAGYDNGNNTANAIQLFNTTDNSLVWDLTAAGITGRGGAGVNFDPGFNGSSAGQGVAWTAFGSGRRGLFNETTGAQTFNLTGDPLGLQWLPDTVPGGNIARDIAFDPATGNLYVRRNNDVDAADRTGDNATANRRTIFDDATDAGAFKIGQKLEFIGDTTEGDLLIFNNSTNAATTQTFVDVVKVIGTDGAAKTATFNLIGGQTGADIGNGSGIYDFDYDPVSNTLAVLDFFNRNVFIFEVGADVESLMGDANGDGKVDLLDLDILGANFGATPATLAQGDFNADNAVNLLDLDILGANFGAMLMPALAVPEPAGVALVLGALAAGLVARRS